MSSRLNVPPDATAHPKRVLVLAHGDLAGPTSRYLHRIGCEVEIPELPGDTAESCAAVLFPPKPELTKPRTRWFSRSADLTRVPVIAPPAFFAWGAFDAVVMQDLWPSDQDGRMIPFGCMVTAADYYLRGNFHQPKIVIVTDPAFYGLMRRSSQPVQEALRLAFDRNAQLQFISVVGSEYEADSLARIGLAVRNGDGRKTNTAPLPKLPRGPAEHENDAPEQARAISLLCRILADYVASRARVVLIDDSETTIRLVAAQFRQIIPERPNGRVHVCDVRSRQVHSRNVFADVQQVCEQILQEAKDAGELLLIVTDILFDGVAWQGVRKTGIDLIELLRQANSTRAAKLGIIGLTGIASPLVMTSAFQRGADAVVQKTASDESSLHHAHVVNDRVVYKLLLTMASHCFQHEFLFAKRHAPRERAREESMALRRILPSYAVSPHLQAEWEATQYLLESQATYAPTASAAADRAVRRIREQYD